MPTYPVVGSDWPSTWQLSRDSVAEYLNDLNDREVALNARVTANEVLIAAIQNTLSDHNLRISELEDWRANDVDPFRAYVENTYPQNPRWVSALVYAVETFERDKDVAKNDRAIPDDRFRPLGLATGLIRDVGDPLPPLIP